MCILLCMSAATVSIIACIADPSCPEEGCHTIDTEEGPVLHHGEQDLINDPTIIEEGDGTYCAGEYECIIHYCVACGEIFYSYMEDPTPHSFVYDNGVVYCALCGYEG